MKFRIEVVERPVNGQHVVVKTLWAHERRRAEKIEDGLNINLGERHYTRIVRVRDTKEPKR